MGREAPISSAFPRFWEFKAGSEIEFTLVKPRTIEKPPAKKGGPPIQDVRWDAEVISSKNAVDKNGKGYAKGEMVTLPGLTRLRQDLEEAKAEAGQSFYLVIGEKKPMSKGQFKGTGAWQVTVGRYTV